MTRDFGWIGVTYMVAGTVAVLVGGALPFEHPVWIALVADVAATVAVFAFSFAFRNSSFYDPYWSVAPPVIAVFWIAGAAPGVPGLRQLVVLGLVALWGARLTWNWARGWSGLGHEDWRYVDLQAQHGRRYWLVSFAGIHMAPTLWVFGGCLALYPAVAAGTRPLGGLDAAAFAVTLGAIWIEARADKELLAFRNGNFPRDAILKTGLWSWSRHPNYFGEMGFWWGLWLFGLAADPSWWWTIVGPLAITGMFRTVSLPMIEDRMRARRPTWDAHAQRTSLVIPRPPKAG